MLKSRKNQCHLSISYITLLWDGRRRAKYNQPGYYTVKTTFCLNHGFAYSCWLLVRTVSRVSDVGHVVHGHWHCLSVIFLNPSVKIPDTSLDIYCLSQIAHIMIMWSETIFVSNDTSAYQQFQTCPRHIPGLYTNMLKSWLNKWHTYWYIYTYIKFCKILLII